MKYLNLLVWGIVVFYWTIISYKKKSIIYTVKDKKEKLTILKDDYYKKNGNLTDMWN